MQEKSVEHEIKMIGRINRDHLHNFRRLSKNLPQKLYDEHIPFSMRFNNKDYERRSQRKAAVSVPLCNINNEASVIFTVRSQHVGMYVVIHKMCIKSKKRTNANKRL